VFGLAVQTHKRRAIPLGHRGNAAFGDIDFIRRRFQNGPQVRFGRGELS